MHDETIMGSKEKKRKSSSSIYHYYISDSKQTKDELKRREEWKRVSKIFTPNYFSNNRKGIWFDNLLCYI